MGHKLGVLHAAISVDEDGDEGLVAYLTDEGRWLPLVASGEERLAFIREMAVTIGAARKMLVVIKRFDNASVVETLDFRAVAEPGKA